MSDVVVQEFAGDGPTRRINGWLGGENQDHGSRQRETRWLTPTPIVDALGPFDLDPCGAPGHQLASTTYLLDEGQDGLRLEYIDAHECDCDELPHSNALHDLANDDVPVLLKVIEQQAAEVERLRRQKSILAEQLQNIARAISLPIGKDHDKAVMELVAERNQLNAEVERLRVALNAECQAADNAERQVRDYERGVR